MNEEKDQVLDHEYDGIQEYDNPLPMWWLVTFFATIIFAFLYYIHYELGGAPAMKDELAQALQVIETRQSQAPKSSLSDTDIEAQIASTDTQMGIQHFNSKCAACHGNELQGGIGPNLTDAYWLHGKGSAADIAKIINEGVLEKGMPAWAALLKPEEVISITAYILSKQDIQAPGAKAPQGEKVR